MSQSALGEAVRPSLVPAAGRLGSKGWARATSTVALAFLFVLMSAVPADAQGADRYNLGRVQPATESLVAEVAPMFNITQVGGYRESANDQGGHPQGNAADLMVDSATGDRVAQYLIDNHERLGLDYIIWKQRIYNFSNPGWRQMEDRGSVSANHYDHIHAQVKPGAKPNPRGKEDLPVDDCAPKQWPDEQVPPDASDTPQGGIQGFVGMGAIQSVCWTLRKLNFSAIPWVNDKTSVQVDGGGGGQRDWFVIHYQMMRTTTGWLLIPLVMLATMHAIAKGSMKALVKIYLAYVPIALIGSVVAVNIVQILLLITDDFSQIFIDQIKADSYKFFKGMNEGFGLTGMKAGVPMIMSVFLAIGLIMATVGMFVILMLREASVYIATAFLPIGFAMLVWPVTSKWFRSMCEFLVGMIFSKVLMVAAIALAVSAMTAISLNDPNNASIVPDGTPVETRPGSDGTPLTPGARATDQVFDKADEVIGDGGTAQGSAPLFTWIGQVMVIIVTFAIMVTAPNMAGKVFGSLALAAAGNALTSALKFPKGTDFLVGVNRWLKSIPDLSKDGAKLNQQISQQRAARRGTTREDQILAAAGAFRVDGSYARSQAELIAAGIDPMWVADVEYLLASNDPNEVQLGWYAYQMGSEFAGFRNLGPGFGGAGVLQRQLDNGQIVPVVVPFMRGSTPIGTVDIDAVNAITDELLRQGEGTVEVMGTYRDATFMTSGYRMTHLTNRERDNADDLQDWAGRKERDTGARVFINFNSGNGGLVEKAAASTNPLTRSSEPSPHEYSG